MPRRADRPAQPSGEPEPLQLAVVPLPTWFEDEAKRRVRAAVCVLVTTVRQLCLAIDTVTADEPNFEIAARTVQKFASSIPSGSFAHVQVRDPELETMLRGREGLEAVRFETVDRLEAVDFLMGQLLKDMFPSKLASPLEGPEVSIDRLRAFADAAALFHAARPWKALHDDDLIEVESPKAPAGMKCVSILGAGGEVRGMGFFSSVASHARLVEAEDAAAQMLKTPRWSFMFHGRDETPPEDLDVWEEHGLRVTEDDAVPILLRYHRSGNVDRPGRVELAYVEGLCRAIAATREAELDSGRWEKTVQCFEGEVRFKLRIPHLLEKPDAMARPPSQRAMMERAMRGFVDGNEGADERTSPQRQARALCEEAAGQRSRRQLQTLREALRLDPDCTEAYLLLARRNAHARDAEPLLRQAVEAGRRALGPDPFDGPGFPFWMAIESRPFMRALAGLGSVLAAQGKLEEAVDVYRSMLQMNPGDNQGIRYEVLPLLVRMGRLEEARAMIESEDYRDDSSVQMDWTAALIAFKQGRSDDAQRLLAQAISRNHFVARLLADPQPPPLSNVPWSAGSIEEAEMVATAMHDVWRAEPAAMRALQNALTQKEGRAKRKSARRKE